jgi:hypothetical protein
VQTANEDATKADAAVSEFLGSNGGVLPSESVDALQSRIVALDVQGAQAAADGDGATVASVTRARAELAAQLAAARQLATKIAPLTQAADIAHQRVADALKVRADAADVSSRGNAAVEFSFAKVNTSVSQTQTWLRQAVAVGAALAILAALLIAWMPARSLDRRRNAVRHDISSVA